MSIPARHIDLNRVSESITMINDYVKDVDTTIVIGILEDVLKSPEDPAHIPKLVDALKLLGIQQGAVLNYAPYVSLLVSVNLCDYA